MLVTANHHPLGQSGSVLWFTRIGVTKPAAKQKQPREHSDKGKKGKRPAECVRVSQLCHKRYYEECYREEADTPEEDVDSLA